MTTNALDRDPLPDRIGNVLKSLGNWFSIIPAIVVLCWWIQGQETFDNALVLWIGCAIVYAVFDTGNYLVSGRR